MNGSGSRGTDVTIPSAACELRKQLADQYGVSERTLRRYVNAYHANGFDGLKPAERVRYRKNAMPDNYEELLELMTHDKKNTAGVINFTLLGGIGDIRINQTASKEDICEALDFYREG